MYEQNRDAPGRRSCGHERGQPRVAAIHDELSGLAETLEQLRARGVSGYALELIGAGERAERLPFDLAQRRYDLIHLCGPGPAAVAALALARTHGVPVAGSYETGAARLARPRARAHATVDGTERATEDGTGRATEDGTEHATEDGTERATEDALAALYAGCTLVLSPSRAADAELLALGISAGRIERWTPGVDLECFSPARYHPAAIPGGEQRIQILYAGRLRAGKGLELLADAFLRAREHDPRLQLVLAGDGPQEQALRRQLGGAASFLGWLARDALAGVYASADLLVFPGSAEPYGRVILEAQASGLPVLAVDLDGNEELIESGRSGCLVPASAPALAAAIHGLARRAPLRERLATGGLAAVREHSWERALYRLADIWDAARRLPGCAAAALQPEPLHEAAHAA